MERDLDQGFQNMEACFLLVNFRERNVSLSWAAVSREERCVTTLITAAKETNLTTAKSEITVKECAGHSGLKSQPANI